MMTMMVMVMTIAMMMMAMMTMLAGGCGLTPHLLPLCFDAQPSAPYGDDDDDCDDGDDDDDVDDGVHSDDDNRSIFMKNQSWSTFAITADFLQSTIFLRNNEQQSNIA